MAQLIDHVREALRCYDAGEINPFEFDEVVHRYKRSVRELWKFCVGSGSDILRASRMLDYWAAEGELPDWWEAGAPRERH